MSSPRNNAYELGLRLSQAIALASLDQVPVAVFNYVLLRLAGLLANMRDGTGVCAGLEIRSRQLFKGLRRANQPEEFGEFLRILGVELTDAFRQTNGILQAWFALGSEIPRGEYISKHVLRMNPSGCGSAVTGVAKFLCVPQGWVPANEERLNQLLAAVDTTFLTLVPGDIVGEGDTFLELPEFFCTWMQMEMGLRHLHEQERLPCPTVRSSNEERDEWLYQLSLDSNNSWGWIANQLRNQHPEWEQLENATGVQSAVKRYIKRHSLPALTPRKRGRQTSIYSNS